jgi:hypothetical protein
VVVHDLDVFRSCRGPSKADPPLIVDTDAVAVGAVTFELLQPIPGRDSEVSELVGGVEDEQLSQGGSLSLLVEALRSLPQPHPFGVFVPERLEHAPSVTDVVKNGQR